MNIRRVVEADFRSSELTLFNAFARDNQLFVQRLRDNDVIVFISKTGSQMLFLHGFTSFLGGTTQALMSTRHRLLTGEWNPLKLKNYAEAAGLSIEGLQRFEEHYKSLTEGSHAPARRKAA